MFPCDLLFIHRDAEGEIPDIRYEEINNAVISFAEQYEKTPHVCVVPVRMTEAWLLFDIKAIRRAAGNPNGAMELNLPPLKEVENVHNPKDILFNAFQTASGLNKRRLKKLNKARCRLRLAELIQDFSPLRVLPAFQRLEEDIDSFFRHVHDGHDPKSAT